MPPKSSKKADPTMTSTGKKSIDAEPDDQEFDDHAVEMIGPLDDGNANGLTDAEKSHVAMADMIKALLTASFEPIAQRMTDLEADLEGHRQELLQEREETLRESLRRTTSPHLGGAEEGSDHFHHFPPRKHTIQATNESPTSISDVAAATAAAEAYEAEEADARRILRATADTAACTDALPKASNLKYEPLADTTQEVRDEIPHIYERQGLGLLLEKNCHQKLITRCAALLTPEITGIAASAALTLGQRIADNKLRPGEASSPCVIAVNLWVLSNSNAMMQGFAAAARRSSGTGAETVLQVTNTMAQEHKAGIKYEITRTFLDRIDLVLGLDDNLDLAARNDGAKFLVKHVEFVQGRFGATVNTYFSEVSVIRNRQFHAGSHTDFQQKVVMHLLQCLPKTDDFASSARNKEMDFSEGTLPTDINERFVHYTTMLDASQARILKIARWCDNEFAQAADSRKATAAAQHKAAIDKAAKDKATKDSNEKATKDKASKDAAAKLRANAAMTRGPYCYDCGKCHHASDTCIHAGKGKVCWNCGDSDHQKSDCPKPVAGNGSAQTW